MNHTHNQNTPDSPEQIADIFKPCGHEPPQGNAQLHGVCLFCYRDRLGLERLKSTELEKRVGELEAEKELLLKSMGVWEIIKKLEHENELLRKELESK